MLISMASLFSSDFAVLSALTTLGELRDHALPYRRPQRRRYTMRPPTIVSITFA
jgi:hypothetical protein